MSDPIIIFSSFLTAIAGNLLVGAALLCAVFNWLGRHDRDSTAAAFQHQLYRALPSLFLLAKPGSIASALRRHFFQRYTPASRPLPVLRRHATSPWALLLCSSYIFQKKIVIDKIR
ncbi:MAG: hypothetical protein R3D26_23445 [Cyanobacteriota/Melainabacteria group bacterium]